MKLQGWMVQTPGEAMKLTPWEEVPGPGEVVVEVAGCGVCHTDLGFFYDGVPTKRPFPLVLGHEVAGTVVRAGDGAETWQGRSVVIPAVLPCGGCPACVSGHGSICPTQTFLGNDLHGGFATHVRVPGRGLCPVPDLTDSAANPHGLCLSTLSVIADAVSTPYQAVLRSGLGPGDLAIFVGAGGVGGFGVQIAAARGATVAAVDVDVNKLERLTSFGVSLTLDASQLDFKSLRGELRALAKERDIPTWRWFIFETSGTVPGQNTAFGLLAHGSYLSVVGFTPHKIELRLSNLMAFDARVEGNWGCLPEHYPAVLDLVLAGKVALEPFVEERPLATINQTFADLHAHRVERRVILVPEQ